MESVYKFECFGRGNIFKNRELPNLEMPGREGERVFQERRGRGGHCLSGIGLLSLPTP